MAAVAKLFVWATVGVVVASAVAIAFTETKLSGVADELADWTGMGEVVAGALFIGAATSLPEAITSMTAAAQAAPRLLPIAVLAKMVKRTTATPSFNSDLPSTTVSRFFGRPTFDRITRGRRSDRLRRLAPRTARLARA